MNKKSTGIVRRIDDLGRVVIPKEVRRQLNISEGDPFELFVTDDGIVCFQKYMPQNECVFCHENANIFFKDKYICEECISELSQWSK